MAGGKLISTGVEFPDATTQTSATNTSASTTELDILDGATLTTTEINYVDGVTSDIQTQINSKQATIADNGLSGDKIDGGTISNFTSTGIDDNATSTAITIDTSEHVYLTSTSPELVVGTTAVSTGNCALNIGQDRTGDGYSFIDLIGDTTYSDFGTRLIRNNNGLNANSTLQHRGTGELQITATEAAPIVFSTNGTERMRILSTGGITFNGDTAAANALDDYEQGTFTCTLTGTTEPGTLITTTGYYTKIGNTVSFKIQFAAVNTTGYAGDIAVTGLPFTSTADRGVVSVASYIMATFTGYLGTEFATSSTIILIKDIKSAATWSAAQHSAGTGRYLVVSGTYLAA
jgi:hypothetical protein